MRTKIVRRGLIALAAGTALVAGNLMTPIAQADGMVTAVGGTVQTDSLGVQWIQLGAEAGIQFDGCLVPPDDTPGYVNDLNAMAGGAIEADTEGVGTETAPAWPSNFLYQYSCDSYDEEEGWANVFTYPDFRFAVTGVWGDDVDHPLGENAPIGGGGFVPEEAITIALPEITLVISAGIYADADGYFGVDTESFELNSTAFYNIPVGTAPGTYTVRVEGAASGRYYETELTIYEELSSTTPVISGKPVVGETLTADPGTWGPEGVALAYQWFADGVAIEGATGQTYVVTAADEGKTITVSVTGSLESYQPVSLTSAGVGPVTKVVVGPLGGELVPQAAGPMGLAALAVLAGVSMLGVRLRRVS